LDLHYCSNFYNYFFVFNFGSNIDRLASRADYAELFELATGPAVWYERGLKN